MWQVFMEIDAKQIHIDIYKTPSNIYEEDQSQMLDWVLNESLDGAEYYFRFISYSFRIIKTFSLGIVAKFRF